MVKRLSNITILTVSFVATILSAPAFAQSEQPGYGLSVMTEKTARGRPADIIYGKTADGFQVKGAVRSRFHNGRIRGHVDIELADADGKILKAGIAKLRRIHYSNKHQHRATFKALFDGIPPHATVLRIRHHVGTKGH
ncbi:MAG: hypothetical protein L3J28_07585 [Candidatus Polarisedimenticolaceae bacterium]|nr:hypothetical protein [Candidatus Polarisedimenticolaceae bacterium]